MYSKLNWTSWQIVADPTHSQAVGHMATPSLPSTEPELTPRPTSGIPGQQPHQVVWEGHINVTEPVSADLVWDDSSGLGLNQWVCAWCPQWVLRVRPCHALWSLSIPISTVGWHCETGLLPSVCKTSRCKLHVGQIYWRSSVLVYTVFSVNFSCSSFSSQQWSVLSFIKAVRLEMEEMGTQTFLLLMKL